MTQDDMGRISQRLADPTLTEEELEECYAGLTRINARFKEKDAQNRNAPVRFSNGLEMSHAKIAYYIKSSSVADFCIRHGLTRAEVLERTGLAQLGAS